MRIAIVNHLFDATDGQGRVNLEIAKYAAQQGHKVTLIAAKVSAEILLIPGINWQRIGEGQLATRLLRYQQFAFATGRWLSKHRHDFDIIHVNGFITYAQSDINAAHFVHSGWMHSKYYRVRPGLRGIYHRIFTLFNSYLERWAFNHSRKIVAVSQKINDELRRARIPSEHINVIINGVDTSEFHPGDSSRVKLDLPEDVFIALFAGDVRDYRKNLDTILAAIVKTPNVHLAVAGRINDGSPFPQLVKSLGIADRVHFLGFRADLPDLMRACDIFIFPSRYEACSLVLLEALSSGMPIITSRTVGGVEILGKECGIVTEDPNDVEALAAALDRLYHSPSDRAAMRIAARAVALEHTWQVMAHRYLELYASLQKK